MWTRHSLRRWVLPVLSSLALLSVLFLVFPFNSGDTSLTEPLGLSLWSLWTQSAPESEDYSYALVVPIVVAFLIYVHRRRLAAEPIKGQPWAVALLILGLALFWLGARAGKQYLGCSGLQIELAGLILWFWGWGMFRLLSFAWIMILFAWPVPFVDAVLAFPMRMIVSHSAYEVLNFIGVPCQQVGTALISAATAGHAVGERFRIDVADPCSGLHSLKPLVMFSALYSYFFLHRRWSQWAVFLCTLPLVIVGNVVRILMLVFGTLAWGAAFALGTSDADVSPYHEFCGYMVFVVVLGSECLLGLLLTRWERLGVRAPRVAAGAPSSNVVAVSRVGVVAGLVGLTVGLWLVTPPLQLSDEAGVLMTLPKTVDLPMGHFVGAFTPVSSAEHTLLPADTEFARKLYGDKAGHSIFFSIVLSGRQQYNIHPPQVCLVAQGWTIQAEHDLPVSLSTGRTLVVRQLDLVRALVLSDGNRVPLHATYLYWYVTADATTPSHGERNWISARDRIFHNQDHRWAYMIVMSPITAGLVSGGLDAAQTKQLLSEFVGRMAPLVQKQSSLEAQD